MIFRNALHLHHFCKCTDVREILETYECGRERVEYVRLGICCSCDERQRMFSEECLEDPGRVAQWQPTWFQGDGKGGHSASRGVGAGPLSSGLDRSYPQA